MTLELKIGILQKSLKLLKMVSEHYDVSQYNETIIFQDGESGHRITYFQTDMKNMHSIFGHGLSYKKFCEKYKDILIINSFIQKIIEYDGILVPEDFYKLNKIYNNYNRR